MATSQLEAPQRQNTMDSKVVEIFSICWKVLEDRVMRAQEELLYMGSRKRCDHDNLGFRPFAKPRGIIGAPNY